MNLYGIQIPCILYLYFDQDDYKIRERLGDDHLILRGGGGLALFGNKYSDLENAGNK